MGIKKNDFIKYCRDNFDYFAKQAKYSPTVDNYELNSGCAWVFKQLEQFAINVVVFNADILYGYLNCMRVDAMKDSTEYESWCDGVKETVQNMLEMTEKFVSTERG